MSEDDSKRESLESDELELDDLFDAPENLEESLQGPARQQTPLRRESVSSASLGFDDFDDFCAPASIKAAEKQISILRRCIKYYAADGDGPFEDQTADPYLHELIGLPKVRGVAADHLRLQQFLSATDKFETRNEEVRARTRKLVRKVQTVMKMTNLQDNNDEDKRKEETESKLAVKDKRRSSKIRRNSVRAQKKTKGISKGEILRGKKEESVKGRAVQRIFPELAEGDLAQAILLPCAAVFFSFTPFFCVRADAWAWIP